MASFRFEEACQIAERLGCHPPRAEQCQYNMFVRERFEKEYKTLFDARGMGTTIWSPLCMGFLAGKYNDGKLPEGSRGATFAAADDMTKFLVERYFGEKTVEGTKTTLQKLAALAAEIGCTQAQLALTWAIANEDTSVALLGFSRLSQIDENCAVIGVLEKWNPELEKKVTAALNNHPNMEMDWRTWTPEESRRPH